MRSQSRLAASACVCSALASVGSQSFGTFTNSTLPSTPVTRTKKDFDLPLSLLLSCTRFRSAGRPPLAYTAAHSFTRASITSRSLRSRAEASSTYSSPKSTTALSVKMDA